MMGKNDEAASRFQYFDLAIPLGLAYIQCSSLGDLLAAKTEAAYEWFYLSRATKAMRR